MRVEINPRGIEDDYLKCLNLCFGNWGERTKYDWYFRSRSPYPDPDMLVLKEDDRLAAGSAVSYRQVAFPNGRRVRVGIMTGSWTLPEFRGQGCFRQMIEESLKLTAQNDGALLLAFVTRENPSFRQLSKAGSALFPTSYIFSTPATELRESAPPLIRLEKSRSVLAEVSGKLKAAGQHHARFIYSSEAEFSSQFVHRPRECELMSDGHGGIGIIERTEQTDLLQLCLTGSDRESDLVRCLRAFLNHSLAKERKLFLFSTRPAVSRAAERLGFGIKAGYLTALAASLHRLSGALGTVEPLKITGSLPLSDPGSPWFLGSWNVHSGDRT